MGILGRLLGRKTDPLKTLEDAIERLQIGITMNLMEIYGTRAEPQASREAVLLANCVLSYATVMDPIGEKAQHYKKTHADLIRHEAAGLSRLPMVAEAFSYLYAAITILLAVRTRDPFSELSAKLGARATELSLYIPNTYDICGTEDVAECIKAITTYSENYKRTLTK